MTAPTIEALPYTPKQSNVAGWWHPIAVDVLGSEYYAFVAPDIAGGSTKHSIRIARRDTSGSYVVGLLRLAAGGFASYADDEGHAQPSIAIDGNGYIHCMTSMHNNSWRYFRSTAPLDVNTMVEATHDMPDILLQYTYPILYTAGDGSVYALLRGGTAGSTDKAGALYRYYPSSKRWCRFAILGYLASRSFYPDDLFADSASKLHALWEWGPSGSGILRHAGSYGYIDPIANKLTDVTGQPVAMPALPTDTTSLVYRPLVDGEDYIANYDTSDPAALAAWNLIAGVQVAKMMMNDTTLVGVLYRWRPQHSDVFDGRFGVYFATYDTATEAWAHETLLDADATFKGTSAAVAASYVSGTYRCYFSLEYTNSAGNNVAQMILAYRSATGSAWTFALIGNTTVSEMRMTLEQLSNGDLLYVSAPYDLKILRYFVPNSLSGVTTFTSMTDLIASLL